MGTRCTCGGGCPTFAACMRGKNIHLGYCQSAKGYDYSRQKAMDSELDAYEAARKQGIKPAGTNRAAVDFAVEASDRSGVAFNAETMFAGGGL